MDVPLRLKYIVLRYGYRESKSPQRFAKPQTLKDFLGLILLPSILIIV